MLLAFVLVLSFGINRMTKSTVQLLFWLFAAAMGASLKKALQDSLKQVSALSTGELLEARFARLMAYGRTKEQAQR